MRNTTQFMDPKGKIREYVAQNLLFTSNGFQHTDDASFLQEGIIDSLGVMDLVAFVESEFSLRVDPQEVTPDNFDSVNKLAEFIERKRNAPSASTA